jgi:hypothetical protein
MKPGKHLTDEGRREILKLHHAGESTKSIMRLTGCSFNTAKKWIRESIPVKAPFPEAEVLALFRRRVSQKEISRTLKIPFRKIVSFARANRFGRPHFHPTQGQTIQIIEMALGHKFSVAEISRAVRSPYDATRKQVKLILQCEKLICGGQEKYGLDSYFPSKYRSPLKPAEPQPVLTPEQREQAALLIVDAVRRAAGSAVADEQLIEVAILTVTTIYMRANPNGNLDATEWEKIRNYFEPHFQDAITTLRTAQQATQEATWKN